MECMAETNDNEQQSSEQQPSGDGIDILKNQPCPFCHTNNLILSEQVVEVPYFNKLYLFSMQCNHCHVKKSDVEALEKKESSRFTLEVTGEEDMNIRIVRSSEATIKIPHVTTITPGMGAEGYITNVEGLLQRVKQQIDVVREEEEDKSTKKKAKNLVKKLQRVMFGQEKLKIIIEDPTGNSAIISPKAIQTKL